MLRRWGLVGLAFLALPAAARGAALRIAASAPAEADAWSPRISRMLEQGTLRLDRVQRDAQRVGRRHERYAQLHAGVGVFGGELVRQADGERTVSVFGVLHEGVSLDTRAASTPDRALDALERRIGRPLTGSPEAELTVLPADEGRYRLCYRVRVSLGGLPRVFFLDAATGASALEYDDLHTQAAVGLGTGVLGDDKKVSASSQSGAFVADDRLRPASLRTYDLEGDVFRTVDFLNGDLELRAGDLARDDDNRWSDGAAVDAHVYAGWVYDFYFGRFGRRGLDDADLPVRSLVHPVRREDYGVWPDYITRVFYGNAGYFGNGVIVYGEGLPPGLTEDGLTFDYLAGGLDVVAHELTHGVTEFTSRLTYRGESGALNEAFSDVMATAVEHSFQPPGAGPLKADYLVGEDVIGPAGLRSLADPQALGNPDHYARRYLGAADNGGVHVNSTIAGHAFYLAIEGGTNRTSGIAVQGLGAGRREEIEAAFYRAFAFLLPRSADFAAARAATLQAARDLQGLGSAAERALAEAWTAVGVP